ncbi:hypothetical protein A9Q83_13325 [Alphaproteobacteria bacterium 46_93_T64]|nr:hypothetical protein A9Q83_13325 [Alphaproteobacteria bacterium 46_93_T64]
MGDKLFLFGQFKWELASGQAMPKLRDKTTALIAFIALSPDGTIRRQAAAELLWENGKDPLASLRQSVREIRDMERSFGSDLFQANAQYLSLDLERIWVDARIATECSSNFDVSIAKQLILNDLGRFLVDCPVDTEVFSDWLHLERTRREEDLENVSLLLLDFLENDALSSAEIKHVARAILKFDQTNERAYRSLMNAYSNEDDRASALRQFDICKDVLKRELSVEPSEETTQLAQKIKSKKSASFEQQILVSAPSHLLDEAIIKPNIYVQDFKTKGNDPILDFVAQTFRSDICEQLSRNERFSVRGGIADGMLAINREDTNFSHSDISYQIKGNVISFAENTAILLQMVDESSGDILWMKRIKPEMKALLSGADEQAILAAIEIYSMIELKETDKSKRVADDQLTSRQCLLRAISLMFRFSEAAVFEAKQYLHRALMQTPGYPEAMSWLAFLKSIELGQGYASDPQATREEAGALIRRSIELSPGSDIGLAIAGHLEAFVYHDFATALEYFDRSLDANPNCAYTWGFSAITHCYVGKPDEALRLLGRCRQIMPFDAHPYYFDTARCIASMLSGRYEDAVRIGRKVLRNNPNFHANYRPLLCSLGHLGRAEEAAPVRREFQKFQPDFSVNWHLENYPPLDKEITENYVNGLRLAGVAEE